jgi:hypothetical protein
VNLEGKSIYPFIDILLGMEKNKRAEGGGDKTFV